MEMCIHCCHIVRKLRIWYIACELVPTQISVREVEINRNALVLLRLKGSKRITQFLHKHQT